LPSERPALAIAGKDETIVLWGLLFDHIDRQSIAQNA
jgi:hypothetical protein